MVKIGHTYELAVVKTVDFGVYLDAENLGEVLLPKKYMPENLSIDDSIRVFLYLDSEDRPVATTQIPKVQVGEFAYLKAVDKNDWGVFLDWGLEKDLLVPFSEQHRPMEVGHSYLVRVYLDSVDARITASSKINKFLEDQSPYPFKPRQKVDLIIANSTNLGFKAIINHRYWGVLYKNEVYERLSFGQSKTGFIQRVRPDGKIDLMLQDSRKSGDAQSKLIEDYLKQQGGFAPVHDKSDPALIAKLFGMSKKAFKKAIGNLYKARVITIEKKGIRLVI